MGVFYWYYGIVEEICLRIDELDVIEYFNIVREFLNDNCFLLKNFKNIVVVKVVRGRYNFKNEVVYLMLYKVCLDSVIVVNNVRREFGSMFYCFLINNCEYFVMWCKIGRSFFD